MNFVDDIDFVFPFGGGDDGFFAEFTNVVIDTPVLEAASISIMSRDNCLLADSRNY